MVGRVAGHGFVTPEDRSVSQVCTHVFPKAKTAYESILIVAHETLRGKFRQLFSVPTAEDNIVGPQHVTEMLDNYSDVV